jgi:CBS domain-containing protein
MGGAMSEKGGAATVCPDCDFANTPGADTCEQCGHSLTGLHPPPPANSLELALVRDRIHLLQPKTPIVVEPSMAVRQVLKMMVEYRIGCVLVVKESRIVGVFTERDAILKLHHRHESLADQPVSEFMTPNAQTLDANAKIAFAVHRMDVGGYRHIPIVDEQHRPIGIVSVRDILRYFHEVMEDAPA